MRWNTEPTPELPNESSSGCAFAYAISSGTELTGSDALTARHVTGSTAAMIGVKSLIGS